MINYTFIIQQQSKFIFPNLSLVCLQQYFIGDLNPQVPLFSCLYSPVFSPQCTQGEKSVSGWFLSRANPPPPSWESEPKTTQDEDMKWFRMHSNQSSSILCSVILPELFHSLLVFVHVACCGTHWTELIPISEWDIPKLHSGLLLDLILQNSGFLYVWIMPKYQEVI